MLLLKFHLKMLMTTFQDRICNNTFYDNKKYNLDGS